MQVCPIDLRPPPRLEEVVAWLEDPGTAWPFSFIRIRAELELDATRIRTMLR